MEFAIIEKGAELDFNLVTKQAGPQVFYIGAGWDTNNGGAVDLDLVAAVLRGGKVTQASDLIYFGNRFGAKGVALSEDNTTGEGDGDDESIVIKMDEVDADVDAIYIGLACYSNVTMDTTVNTHFRICDGDNENSEQIADVKLDGATAGSTVLNGVKLSRGTHGWTLTNVDEFHSCGNGTEAISGFGKLFA